MNNKSEINIELKCFHCGLSCDDTIFIDEKYFCCRGCKTVYEILSNSGLEKYYKFEVSPGLKSELTSSAFDYLDRGEVFKKLTDFADDHIAVINFYIPQMHCSSCIWLLENIYKFNPAIRESKVNFLKKSLTVKFYYKNLSLKELVILLTSIGYEPLLNLEMYEEKKNEKVKPQSNKELHYRIGVAGFCFGNIMLLSFPEYLSIPVSEKEFRNIFLYLNLILSLPVFFYSASGYFISAWKALKLGIINIDFPLSLGILTLFLRSVYELLIHGEAGYFDSMAGLVFFLLIGKLFQTKTYETLNFERNYKSYFPLAVIKKEKDNEISIPVTELKKGDRVILRNNEIIPSDSILIKGDGKIDYSFVTGESIPVKKKEGEFLFAGGKQIGAAVELEIVKEVSQSYLTQLWNDKSFEKQSESSFTIFSNQFSRYFTYAILIIAITAALIQFHNGMNFAVNVFTAVLIVACPCALAMSVPFTFGNTLRIMGRNKFYLKSIRTVEELAKTDTIVFDKTGTLTSSSDIAVSFNTDVDEFGRGMIRSLVRNSTHPLSKIIYDEFKNAQLFDVTEFREIPNAGIEGVVLGHKIKIGSDKLIPSPPDYKIINNSGNVYLSIDDRLTGTFEVMNVYREGVDKLIPELDKNYKLFLLTGDNEKEKERLLKVFPQESSIKFKCTPEEKLKFIGNLQEQGKRVMMVGDGLNDAGALAKSNTGIAVADNINIFTPASDAILEAGSLKKLNNFLKLSSNSVKIIYVSYAISLIYNIAGISFAVQGLLTPIIAAILMPLSSISVVLFAITATNIAAKRGRLLFQS